MATLRSGSDLCKPNHVQPAHILGLRHETYKAKQQQPAHEPSNNPGLTVIRLVSGVLTNAIDFPSYRLIKKSAWYDDDVAMKWNNITRKTAVRMNERAFSGINQQLIIAFLQNFEVASRTCNTNERTAMWLFKHYISHPFEAVIKIGVALPTETAQSNEVCLTSFSKIVDHLLKRFCDGQQQ